MENITSDEIYVSLICNGEFNAVPGFPIGELFESFFDNINYNVVREEEKVYVDFTGDATCDDEPCTILIRFEVDISATEFEIVLVKVDEDVLNEAETIDLLEDIAYVGGAELSDEYCDCGSDCDGNCHSCGHEDCDCNEDDYDEEDNEDEKCDCEKNSDDK